MSTDNEEESTDTLDDLIHSGSEIAGGAIGGAIGLLGGPAGAIAGGAAGVVAAKVLKKVGTEISERVLGQREKVRTGGTLALATVEIRERLKQGENVRNDDFFDAKTGSRSKADEFAEAVLLKAQREAEEKKIPYLATFLANAVFDSKLNIEMAHQLIKASESLTYRQFVILRLAAVKDAYHLKATKYGNGTFSVQTVQLLYEIHDLARREFLNFSGEAVLGVSDVTPSKMNPMGMGAHLYNYLRLANIPDSDVSILATQLQ